MVIKTINNGKSRDNNHIYNLDVPKSVIISEEVGANLKNSSYGSLSWIWVLEDCGILSEGWKLRFISLDLKI